MRDRERIQTKASSIPTNAFNQAETGLFRKRPFAVQAETETDTDAHPLPDLQTQLERGARFNESLSRMKVYGNRPVIQPKIAVGAPGDRYEQEADQVADRVMNMKAPTANPQPVQRQQEEQAEESLQMQPLAASITPLVQREASLEEEPEEQVQPKAIQRQEASLEEEPEEQVQPKTTFQIAPMLIQTAPTTAPPTQPTLRQGSSGSEVEKLQQRLNAQGSEPPLKIDGSFGTKTKAAVLAFQPTHKDFEGKDLEPDGIVGSRTWWALDQEAATPKTEATEDAMGQHVVKGMDANNNDPHTADQGVHYAHNYKANFPKLWKEDYWKGYADPTYFERTDFMDWRLKPKRSASAAIQSWLRGLTIAECNSAIVAIEIDTLRASISDAKFDERFGSTDKIVPEDQRLRIKPGTQGTPVEKFMTQTVAVDAKGDAGTVGKRHNLKVGGWYYFYNHPKYLLKHPGGAFQGENAIFMGEDAGQQLWAGMGVPRCTEVKMLEEMVDAYNDDRDARDLEVLENIRQQNGGTLPPEYDPASGEFPDQLSGPDEVLNAPEYELNGTKRKGGFVKSGKMLDATSVQQLRDE